MVKAASFGMTALLLAGCCGRPCPPRCAPTATVPRRAEAGRTTGRVEAGPRTSVGSSRTLVVVEGEGADGRRPRSVTAGGAIETKRLLILSGSQGGIVSGTLREGGAAGLVVLDGSRGRQALALSSETEVDPKSLPKAVTDAAEKAVPGAVREAEEVCDGEGRVVAYVLEKRRGEETVEIRVTPDGRVLRVEDDDDEEDGDADDPEDGD